jgi:hypothetical protein
MRRLNLYKKILRRSSIKAWLSGILLGLTLVSGFPAWTCSLGAFNSWHWSKETLIARTENIIVAEVVQAEDKKQPGKASLVGQRVLYRFKAVEVLKGKEPMTFVLFGALPDQSQGPVKSSDPRTIYGSDCNPIVDFELHKKYVIFEPAFNGYAYQEYLGPKDKWYLKIKEQVSKKAFK